MSEGHSSSLYKMFRKCSNQWREMAYFTSDIKASKSKAVTCSQFPKTFRSQQTATNFLTTNTNSSLHCPCERGRKAQSTDLDFTVAASSDISVVNAPNVNCNRSISDWLTESGRESGSRAVLQQEAMYSRNPSSSLYELRSPRSKRRTLRSWK